MARSICVADTSNTEKSNRSGGFEPCDSQKKSDMEVLVIVLLIFFNAAEEA